MVSISPNGDRFDNTIGSVFGSFFVVNTAISASSELISLKIPDDVLSDVVDPVRIPHQSVVSAVNEMLSLCVGDDDFDLVPSSLLHCRMNFNERF